MTIKTAINKAIEGGYKKYKDTEFDSIKEVIGSDLINLIKVNLDSTSCSTISLQEMLLDPSFWQALGKSMGWGICINHNKDERIPRALQGCDGCMDADDENYYWHKLIDHLSEGKSLEDFFKKL